MDKLPLGRIRTDGGTQMRVNIDTDTMLEYRDAWKSGATFDPIDVFYDGATYWLADGFHRFYGAREAKKKDIIVRVHNGSVREAILFACGANLGHGLKRTNADKRQAVLVLLEDDEWSTWSDRQIAERCGVSNQFVSNMRAEVSTVDTSPPPAAAKRKGKDGKSYPANSPKRVPIAVAFEADDTEIEESAAPSQKQRGPSEAYQQLQHWWGKADDAAKTLFRLWIDGEV